MSGGVDRVRHRTTPDYTGIHRRTTPMVSTGLREQETKHVAGSAERGAYVKRVSITAQRLSTDSIRNTLVIN